MREYIDQTEAGRRLGVTRQQVAKWIDAGRLKTVEIAGRRLIVAASCKKPKRLKPGRKPAKQRRKSPGFF